MVYRSFMARAIELSKRGLGLTYPNPIVGAVIVSAAGEVIGEGFHAGGDHAEVVALMNCATRGLSPVGATILVTLEPCNHTGKRPPCTKAILDAGITTVVFAVGDPNPVAMGGGDFLSAQGLKVVSKVLENESWFANRAWLHKIVKNRPYISWKIASTFDGFTAASDGTSKWISSEESRSIVQKLRAESDAILIGTGTALADNPSLIPRGDTRRPLRIVMGERKISSEANLFNAEAETLILPSRDIETLIQRAQEMGLNSILLEAGATLGTAFLMGGYVDEIHWFRGPTFLGGGTSAIGDLNLQTIDDAMHWAIVRSEIIGPDSYTILMPKAEVHI
jgi:diaminohydroxyphosphoribosylaminopyrimidine deaminase/5-amino-6-(5-phosphoribosylamino)uracil reductase